MDRTQGQFRRLIGDALIIDNPSRPLLFATGDRLGTLDRMNRRQFGRIATMAAALPFTPVLAQRVDKYAEQLTNGEFNWFPERSESGPIIAIVSLPDQRVYVYRNGLRIAASSCSTGKLGHRTPTGVFKILQKDKNHHSSTYNNAPMPYLNRLTWSGIALHAGQLPGYPASHGCVRLPKDFAELLFGVTKLGMTVVIADDKSQPEEVTHPGMVLGEYAAREFNAVDTAIKATEYSEGHERAPKSPSVVASGPDRLFTVFAQRREVDSRVPQWRPRGFRQGRDSESREAARRACIHLERRRRSVRSPVLA